MAKSDQPPEGFDIEKEIHRLGERDKDKSSEEIEAANKAAEAALDEIFDAQRAGIKKHGYRPDHKI